MTLPPLWSDEVEAAVRAAGRNMDEQETPIEVKFCTRCVTSNQRPRIVFDDEGVCSACRYAERKKGERSILGVRSPHPAGIDWTARGNELDKLLDAHRSTGAYDCIVPCSGGKDSAFVAHNLKHVHGMHPVCISWAPHMFTDIGLKNMQAFIHSGFDVVTAQPNGLLHRKLARLGLEFYGDPFLPFIYGQLAWPMRAAMLFNIPLVFYGENGEAEYGGDPAANDKPCWSGEDWERVYMKGAGVIPLLCDGEELGAISEAEMASASKLYQLPPKNRMENVQFHWLGYYTPWHPQANYYYACENTGFEPADERSEGTYSRYASIDDKLDGLHYWMGYLKFGMGRCTSDASHEVRDGELTREEAVMLVKKYDGEFPDRHMPECLEYLGLDHEQLTKIAARFRPDHLWQNIIQVYLKHAVFDAGVPTDSAA